jgi:chorismate synthase
MWLAGNSIGREFVFTSFGESHGSKVGALIDGCPPGLPISEEDIQRNLDMRIPLQNPEIVSSRVEKDVAQILSGVFNGFTTGAPICLTVENKETRSTDYESIKDLPRPAHADYTARVKYGGFNDYRGGGRFSGRTTVSTILAGAVAKKLLTRFNVDVLAFTKSIGKFSAREQTTLDDIYKLRYETAVRCPDLERAEQMERSILKAKKAGESIGGIIECLAINVPVGIGEPLFDSLDSDLAKALFAIPAVKGVEFGGGFDVTQLMGSEANDSFEIREGKVMSKTNMAGGILGGISSGMPIVIRVAIKPTPSISKEQHTVNLKSMEETKIRIGGRHDPCVVPKAVPVMEATVAIVLADHMIRSGFIPRVL